MQYNSRDSQNSLILLLARLQRCQRQEGGYTLVVTLGMLLILTALLVTAAVTSKLDSASTRASARSNQGFAAAEAGLNIRASRIRETFQNFNQPSDNDNDETNNPQIWEDCIAGNTEGGDFACDNALNLQGQNVSTFVQDVTDFGSDGFPSSITIPPGERFAGLNAQEYRYDVLSVAQDQDGSATLPTAILGMRFKSRLIPLFQFAAFYNKDLEILPGPNMTLSGPVHTNGDLYLNAGATLRIRGQVTVGDFTDEDGNVFATSLYRGRKNDARCGGTAGVDRSSDDTQTNFDCDGDNRMQFDANSDVSPWGGRVEIGIDTIEVPDPSLLDPDPANEDAQYWQQADLRVVLDLDVNNDGDEDDPNDFAIQVRNLDNTINVDATNALNRRCRPIVKTLRDDDDGSSVYEAEDVVLRLNNTNNLEVGDVISITQGNNVLDSDSNVITEINGNTITLKRQLKHDYQAATNIDPNGANSIRVRKAVVSTSDSFYNYREGKFIRMLDVDIQGLLTCVDESGNFLNQNFLNDGRELDDETQGGLVFYFTVEGADSNVDVRPADQGGADDADGNNYGIRIYNGAELASTQGGAPDIQGLTIATDQALYLRGDYNSVNKKPASFLADSLNVLSEAWDFGRIGGDPDTDSFDGRRYTADNLPDASGAGADSRNDRMTVETTINAAFLSGTDNTGGANGVGGQNNGEYNGGLENYPRFHERWTGTDLNYRGSFISLNKARRVDGAWGNQSYSPPGRQWDFDVDFRNAANLPPLSPRFVILKQELFERTLDRAENTSQINLAAAPSMILGAMPSLQPKFRF